VAALFVEQPNDRCNAGLEFRGAAMAALAGDEALLFTTARSE
jgi:hypothetical protein